MREHLSGLPLGPFEGRPIFGFTTRTGKRVFHLDSECGRLSRSSPVAVTEVLSNRLLERLCDGCFTYPNLAPRGSSLNEFANAAFSPLFAHRLSCFTIEDVEDDLAQDGGVDHDTAVRLLASAAGDEDEDDQTYAAAQYRDRLLGLWRQCFDSLADCAEVLARYPWLRSWASKKVAGKEQGLGLVTERLNALLPPFALLANAVAAGTLPDDVLRDLSEDARLAAVGTTQNRMRFVASVRNAWAYGLACRLPSPGASRYSAWWQIEERFGRNRKGKKAAAEATEEFVAAWDAVLADLVTTVESTPATWIVVRIPRQPSENERIRGDIPDWALAVAAIYGAAHDWPSRRTLLHTPAVIAERLLEEHRELEPSVVDEATAAHGSKPHEILAAWKALSELRTPVGPLPGLLDDGPIGERRLVTIGDIEALKLICDPEERLVTFSLSGIEVIGLDEAADRCSEGWTGTILMRLGSAPKSFTDGNLAETPADQSGPEPPFHRYSLSADEAAVRFAADVRADRYTNHDPAKCLASYAVARTLPDLRVLGSREVHGPVSWRVWVALLSDEPLDLDPFRRTGLGIPIGILNTVQTYTARYGGNKHHGMSCQHLSSGRVGLDKDAELLTFSEMLTTNRYEWCLRCGGYSVRRMTTDQYRYYQAACSMHRCAQALDSIADGLPANRSTTESLASIVTDLRELGTRKITSDLYSRGEWRWEWDRIHHELVARAEKLLGEAEPLR